MLLALLACRSPVTVDTPSDSEPSESVADSPLDSEAAPTPQLFINELLSDNRGSTLSPWGEALDWLELYNGGDEAIDLSGWTISDDFTEPTLGALPALSLEPGEHLLLWPDGHGEQEHSLPFGLSSSSESVHLFDPEGQRVDWVQFPGLARDTAYARVPDGGEDWLTMPWGTPGEANREVELTELSAVEAGSTWSYLDDGVGPGEGWATSAYEASDWAEGTAPLGYGDEDIVTTVSYGDDSGDKHVTTWFRRSVELPSGAEAAELRLQCDDGCLVWIEGGEVARRFLPEGDIEADTRADETASGSSETEWTSFELDPAELPVGEAVIGVEVHQVSAGSSDIRMDLELDFVVLQ